MLIYLRRRVAWTVECVGRMVCAQGRGERAFQYEYGPEKQTFFGNRRKASKKRHEGVRLSRLAATLLPPESFGRVALGARGPAVCGTAHVTVVLTLILRLQTMWQRHL